ncbi:hypothetical protein Pcinc_003001 [Petrolisthes cinctipes]|uniref:Uncharacterized protein n=1 Tax=Petrolisthes cinctipes TaxID=88211 RepID=A0AAE1GJT2_PETCI|nr:hypothetical protein Pcinc_003001 [Petrolisthes cinctipes]
MGWCDFAERTSSRRRPIHGDSLAVLRESGRRRGAPRPEGPPSDPGPGADCLSLWVRSGVFSALFSKGTYESIVKTTFTFSHLADRKPRNVPSRGGGTCSLAGRGADRPAP